MIMFALLALCLAMPVSAITAEDHHILQKPQMHVIGIECRTSNNPEAGPRDIPRLWDKFYSLDVLNQIPNKTSHDVIALYCDYEGDYTQPYSCVIGCPVASIEEIPEGMVAKTVPEAAYAVFPVTGELPAGIINAWGKIWQTPLSRTYTGDFEVYGEKVEILIAVDKNDP